MLTTLNLGTNNLKDVSGLHGLTQLKTLSLVDNDLEETTSIIGVIKTCLNLMELHISHNGCNQGVDRSCNKWIWTKPDKNY